MKKRFSKVIIAKHLFDGINEKDYEGYLCLSGNHIVEKKAGKPEKDILNQAQEVLNFRDELVMPGITDTHTFFTGYAIYHVGADFSKVTDNEAGCCILRNYWGMDGIRRCGTGRTEKKCWKRNFQIKR